MSYNIATVAAPSNAVLEDVSQAAARESMVPLFFIQLPPKTLARQGLDTGAWEYALERIAGIDISQIDSANCFMTLSAYRDMVKIGQRMLGLQNHLAWYVEDVHPHHYGPIGLAIMTAPTIGEVITMWADMITTFLPLFSVQITQDTDHLECQFIVNDDLSEVEGLILQTTILLCHKFLKKAGVGPHEMKVNFTIDPVFSPDYYYQNFKCIPEFNCEFSSITLCKNTLDNANHDGNPFLHQQALRHVDELKSALNKMSTTKQRVMQYLMTRLYDKRSITLDETADFLTISPRTLSRKLQQEGVSFRDLISELKIEHAKQKLKNTRATISDICIQVGFSNLSAFSRAFRKYTQKTPSEFRSQFS